MVKKILSTILISILFLSLTCCSTSTKTTKNITNKNENRISNTIENNYIEKYTPIETIPETNGKGAGNIEESNPVVSESSDSKDNNLTVSDNNINTVEENPENQPTANDNNETLSKTENSMVRLFFYIPTKDSHVYMDTVVSITDKAIVKALISGLQNPPSDSIEPLVNKSVTVKSATLDRNNNMITVDFSSDFVTLHQYGSAIQAQMLQTITNTLGYNFNVDNVIITVAGEPYESGHITMAYGESFKVDYSKYSQFN